MHDYKLGQIAWVVIDGNPCKVELTFVAEDEVGFIHNDVLQIVPICEIKEYYDGRPYGAKDLSNMIVCCRETSKCTGEISVYTVYKDIKNCSFNAISIRNRYNNELQYFACFDSFFEENSKNLEDFNFFQDSINDNYVIII